MMQYVSLLLRKSKVDGSNASVRKKFSVCNSRLLRVVSRGSTWSIQMQLTLICTLLSVVS